MWSGLLTTLVLHKSSITTNILCTLRWWNTAVPRISRETKRSTFEGNSISVCQTSTLVTMLKLPTGNALPGQWACFLRHHSYVSHSTQHTAVTCCCLYLLHWALRADPMMMSSPHRSGPGQREEEHNKWVHNEWGNKWVFFFSGTHFMAAFTYMYTYMRSDN